jgi:hypothetical protein
MASPDRKDDKRDASRAEQAALTAKNRADAAAERKRKADLYAIAARKAEKTVKDMRAKAPGSINRDEGNVRRSQFAKDEFLKNFDTPPRGTIWGEGPYADAVNYADKKAARSRNAEKRIRNRVGSVTMLPDGTIGYKDKKKN